MRHNEQATSNNQGHWHVHMLTEDASLFLKAVRCGGVPVCPFPPSSFWELSSIGSPTHGDRSGSFVSIAYCALRTCPCPIPTVHGPRQNGWLLCLLSVLLPGHSQLFFTTSSWVRCVKSMSCGLFLCLFDSIFFFKKNKRKVHLDLVYYLIHLIFSYYFKYIIYCTLL